LPKDLTHFASNSFWKCYDEMPRLVQKLADKNFEILKKSPQHPSLHMKKAGKFWSVRVGIQYRALN